MNDIEATELAERLFINLVELREFEPEIKKLGDDMYEKYVTQVENVAHRILDCLGVPEHTYNKQHDYGFDRKPWICMIVSVRPDDFLYEVKIEHVIRDIRTKLMNYFAEVEEVNKKYRETEKEK